MSRHAVRPNGFFLTGIPNSFMMAALISIMLCGASVRATTLPEMTFDDLVAMSDQVFIATVDTVESELTPNEKMIFTYVTFVDIEPIEGIEPLAEPYTMRFSGGHVGNRRSIYLGMPQFESGQRVVLFTHLNGEAMCPLVGWSQGCFHVDGPDQNVIDASGNAVTGIDLAGRLLRANNPHAGGAAASCCPAGEENSLAGGNGVTAYLGESDDGHSSGEIVVNVQDEVPPLTVPEFVEMIHASRDWLGYQPFEISSQPNHWIPTPTNPAAANSILQHLTNPAPAPQHDNAWIPEALPEPAPPADEPSTTAEPAGQE